MSSIEFVNNTIKLIDQTKIPFKKEYFICKNTTDVVKAIKEMRVRGAPAIGIVGAYGVVLAKNDDEIELIRNARPTAIDLKHAVNFVVKYRNRLEGAKLWQRRIEDKCKRISVNGSRLIRDGINVLTHCNTGPLATGSYGTALGAIIEASKTKKIFVYVDETRPRVQGAITSWELNQEKIEHCVVVDSASGYLMKRKKVNIVLAGADRITANGDVANKIGTYNLAVLAKENNVPFYVLAPLSTFDFNIKSGEDITIEERDKKEVLEIYGNQIYPEKTEAFNPAFDITPAKYVTGYVTEFGIHTSIEEIKKIEQYEGIKFEVVNQEELSPNEDVEKIINISKKLSKYFKPQENEGNLSIKSNLGFLIKRTGTRLVDMARKDVVLVTKIDDGKVFANGTPSSESQLHNEVYKTRMDISIVLHFHDDNLLKSNKFEETGPFEYGTVESAMAAADKLKKVDFIKIREHGFILVAKSEKELFEKLKEMYR